VIKRARTEAELLAAFLRSGGWPRAALVTGCTALVSGLMLVALTVILFTRSSSDARELVSGLVAQDGLRGGYVFALLLICVAPLALLRQVVRLGTATREQRLASLRLAGATPGEVRRIGAIEVGIPALVGGLLGYLVFGAFRLVFGGSVPDATGSGAAESEIARELALVPTSVDPAWWHFLVIATGVGLIGMLAGASASRSLVISPLGVSRRAPRPAPRPWGVLLLVLAVPMFQLSMSYASSDLFVLGFVATLVLGMLALAPWLAYRAGRAVAGRASSVPVLMAGRRLTTDARSAGRAAAAVGAIALVAGGGGVLLAELPHSYQGGDFGDVEAFYIVPIAVGGVVLLAALLLVIFSMAVHGVESLIDRKRSLAALAALGGSTHDLERAQRWEVGLVAVPMAVIGVLIGSGPYRILLDVGANRYAWIPLLVDCVTVALAWLAVWVSSWITRPWLLRAAAPANLRTP
jgi:hypothetical protein